MKYAVLFSLLLMMPDPTFKEAQLQHTRVKAAYEEKEAVVKQLFDTKELSFGGFEMFLRAFKKEKMLEVWIKEKGSDKFVFLRGYQFCTTSGTLGPKRKEGDLQIPEGVYYINHFNPLSNYHLSLGLNYPNASDKKLSHPTKPGGNIYIHGDCVTIGCIPVSDAKIKELYIMAVEAKSSGQEKIPVHIFPDRLEADRLQQLITDAAPTAVVKSFWENLAPIYKDFETTRRLREVKVNEKGEYYF